MGARKTSPGAVASMRSEVFTRLALTTTDIVGLANFRPPVNIQVLAFSVVARAKGGTHAATVFTLKNGATTVATADYVATAAGVRLEGTIVNELVAADTELTVDFTETGGTTPTLDDISIQIDYVERY
jgi:hypothetical protein